MRIEEDLKLGFKDVLIRPKRSTLKSRSDVELERQFTFKHSGQTWSGVPIIAANMDTVGTFAMATALASFDILTAVHKHYSIEEWNAFVASASENAGKIPLVVPRYPNRLSKHTIPIVTSKSASQILRFRYTRSPAAELAR